MSTNNPAPAAQLHVKVVPGARQDQIVGRHGDALKIRISAPPEAGKANQAVLRLIADALNLRRGQIHLLRGHSNPKKILQITGLSQLQLDERLRSFL